MVDGPSRRGLLAGAAAAFGGVVVAGCGASQAAQPTIPVTAPRGAPARGDVPILTTALAMERRTITAYAACIPLLASTHAPWAQACAVGELQQAGSIDKLIHLAGGSPPPLFGQPAIGHPRDGEQALALMQALETAQVAHYLRCIPQLSSGTVRASVASILASDAQHVTVLRQARGESTLTLGVLAGDGGDGALTRRGLLASAHADVGALQRLLAAQQLSLACDERVLAARAFSGADGAAHRLVSAVAAQDRAQVAATHEALRRRGAAPASSPSTVAAIDAQLARHRIPGRPAQLRGPRDALQLLVDVQRAAIGAAYVGLSRIRDGALATLVARMMAADAQHEVLLAQAVDPGDVTGALPAGIVDGIA